MKILIASPIDSKALERLQSEHDVVCAFGAAEAVLASRIRDREVLIFRSGVTISAEVLMAAPELRLLIRAGSGTDNLALDYIAQHGLKFVRIPEPGARAVAEHTFGLMLALARNIPRADWLWRRGRWAKHELTGHLLRGKTLGIVGAGSIGSQVGEMGTAWGMKALGCVAHPSPAVAAALRTQGIRLTDFDEVVRSADFLCIHVPLLDSTRNLIDASVLERMKAGSFLVNLARGGVVDEAALRQELIHGKRLLGAAMDVHQAEGEGRISPLADLPNVVLTPHIGAMTEDTQREIGERVLSIVETYAAQKTGAVVSEIAS